MIHAKLMQARCMLQNAKLEKTGHNKFAGYNYFELGDFLPTVQTIFSDLKMCGVVSYTADIAKLTITDTEDGTAIEITSPMGSAALKGCHEVQNIGAVETYQRRYLWVTAMEIVEHDALDATVGKDKPSSVKPITKSVFDELPPDEQEFLRTEAAKVTALLDKGEAAKAKETLEGLHLDADEKTAIWSLFDPKQRETLYPKRKAA